MPSEYMAEFSPASTCLKGHRRSLLLETAGGGSICLSCFAALASDPRSPKHHISYALSQLKLALDDPNILFEFRRRYAYLLVAPLVAVLSVFNDEGIAHQVMDLVSDLCFRGEIGRFGEGSKGERAVSTSLSGDFISRIADRLASGALAWSQRQIYMLHCFGELLSSHMDSSPAAHIREHVGLFSNLLAGLQLPSEELRGEILFVIYKLCSLNITPWEDVVDDESDCAESMDTGASVLLRLALEILLKTQHDEVRLNCLAVGFKETCGLSFAAVEVPKIWKREKRLERWRRRWKALLRVLVGKNFLQNLYVNSFRDIYLNDTSENMDALVQQSPLISLFADAVKGSLLSSDEDIQMNTLELIFLMISPEICSNKQLQVLVEENIPDYIFEILRMSGNKDPVIISCLQVLVLFANAEEVFKKKLIFAFSTLLSVLRYTSQIPMHPAQPQVLTLVCNCISNFPGIISMSQLEEVAMILTCILRRCTHGELPETFTLACSTFVEILKIPSAIGIQKIGGMIKEASTCAVLYSFSLSPENPTELKSHSLFLLKEAHAHSRRKDFDINTDMELEENVILICQNYLLPWMESVIHEEVEEDLVQEVLQIFHLILLDGSEVQTHIFAYMLISSSWLTLCFTYMGLFPTNQMRSSIYLILGSLIDRAFGSIIAQPIRNAFLYLPPDPFDLIFLLGQKSTIDPQLAFCQRATLLLLYVSSLSGERLADDAQILASLEQYILINNDNLFCQLEDSLMLTQVVHLYGLLRDSLASEKMSYSPAAEKTLLDLLSKYDLELFSLDIHPTSLKWLFQQEEIKASMSNQILKFCRLSGENKSSLTLYSHGRGSANMRSISELVASGDNYVASLLVSLLIELHQDGEDDDLVCVMNAMARVLKIFPDASIQFCLHNFAGALCGIYCSPCCSPQLFTVCSLLVLNVLYAADNNVISQPVEWLAVTMKLLELVSPRLASQPWDQEDFLVLGIFCLILHRSRGQVLEEASKAILLSIPLASAVENIVQTAYAKGPALVDHCEETETGRCLLFVLLLNFFSLKCLCAGTIQECLDWQDLLQSSTFAPQSSVIAIKCHDLCHLMHFGSSLVKSLSSLCLVDILGKISQQRQKTHEKLACSMKYLQSMIAIMEGLVFHEDKAVATNCCICLSLILSWESLGDLKEKMVIRISKWLRTIMEEFLMTLAAPGMASKFFRHQHKPASHIATALLSMDPTPEWIASVFDSSSISGILNNLCAQKLSIEMVNLFRALQSRNLLDEGSHTVSETILYLLPRPPRSQQVGQPSEIINLPGRRRTFLLSYLHRPRRKHRGRRRGEKGGLPQWAR
ncbi:Protein PRD1 [Platanthera guangdongensis]|uniref:Protein PRD1 n=1 Tax=Platanthera guangdongensis TaxID=2320717 RepID=A0ABR2LE44_9ASPA